MKSTSTILLAVSLSLSACAENSSSEESSNTGLNALAEADAAMADARAALAPEANDGGLKVNGGMDEIDAKISAEANLKALLKDADAAKFRNMFLARLEGGNLILCGEVNSKNSFGGYTGFKRFIASPNPEAPTVIEGEAPGLGTAFPQAYSAACPNVVERF